MGCEIFKDKGFLLKFIECIVIIGLAIAWCGFFMNRTYVNWAFHLSQLFLDACFFAFFPALIMMVLYATNGFNDHLYELVVAIFGAVAGLLCGVFMFVHRFADTDDYDYSYQNQESLYEEGRNKEWGYYRHDRDEFNNGLVAMGVLAFGLMACFIADAILNGSTK